MIRLVIWLVEVVQRGVDIYKIAKLAGHEDIRMTRGTPIIRQKACCI
jgi:hypothetical protein